VYFRRTPNATRIAAVWMRRARETPGTTDRVKAFLDAQGDKKVKSPNSGNEVQISSLKSSDAPADRQLFQDLLSKWKASGDDADPDAEIGRPKTEIKTEDDLKKVVDDLIEDAVGFGLTEEEAREYTKGLRVTDGAEAIQQVEKNLQRAIDKRIEENKAKAEAAKAKEEADKAEEEARKAEEKAAEEKRALRTDTKEALAGFRQELFEAAQEGSLTTAEARRILEPLVLNADKSVVDSVKAGLQKAIADKKKKAERRKSVRERPAETAAAVAAANSKLDAAKASKDKDAIAQAKADLETAEDQHRAAEMNATDADFDEENEAMSDAELEAAQATADAQAARSEIDSAQERIDELREKGGEGSADEIAQLEESMRAAEETIRASEAKTKALQDQLAAKDAERSRKLVELSKQEFEKSWERAEKSRGMVLFNSEGKATQYNPARNDAIYNYMMTLLGEQVRQRGMSEIDTSSRGEIGGVGGAGADAEEGGADAGGGKGKGKGKGDGKGKGTSPVTVPRRTDPGAGELMSKPTKSGRPRLPNGDSPRGGDTDDYGPHEFWKINDDMWSAKNSKNNHRTFRYMQDAREYAKTASSPNARVASRYLRGKS